MPGGERPRVILHADMDAFYAAVEQLDDPSLRGRPVLIGHPGRRGVVATASYEARPSGVGSAMPMAEAMRRCPEAVVVPPRFGRYQEISGRVMEVFGQFSPRVEPLSLDEAFLDMTGAEALFGPPARIGRSLKQAVREATGGLTVSVGVAPSKYVAKVASDYDKPDGLTVVAPDEVLHFLHPLPVSRLWGVGPKGQARLAQMGLFTIGEVASTDRERLVAALGSMGDHILRLSRGEDPRPVIPDHEARSIGSEHTLGEDVRGAAEIRPHLLHSADRVASRLRKAGLVAHGLRVKLKTHRFRLMTRQSVHRDGADSAEDLYARALELLPSFDLSEPMRLVGLAAFQMVSAGAPEQQDLFTGTARRRRRRLDQALDGIRDRFGDDALQRASDLAADRSAEPPAGHLRPPKPDEPD